MYEKKLYIVSRIFHALQIMCVASSALVAAMSVHFAMFIFLYSS